jgi:hypothetical protein
MTRAKNFEKFLEKVQSGFQRSTFNFQTLQKSIKISHVSFHF